MATLSTCADRTIKKGPHGVDLAAKKKCEAAQRFPPRMMIVVPAHDVLKQGDGLWGCDKAL